MRLITQKMVVYCDTVWYNFFFAASKIYTSNSRKATRMLNIWVTFFSGSTQNSWKKTGQPSTSTGTQNTITDGITFQVGMSIDIDQLL